MSVMSRKCRETGFMVTTIVHENGTVCLQCDEHGGSSDFDSQYEAAPFKAHPSEWCEDCAEIIYGKEI